MRWILALSNNVIVKHKMVKQYKNIVAFLRTLGEISEQK